MCLHFLQILQSRFKRQMSTSKVKNEASWEESARQQIDTLLHQSGWIVRDRSQTNLAAGPGVAIHEAVLETGEVDYLFC